MKYIKTSKAPEAIGPYSQAVLAQGFLFVSGQIAMDGGSIEAQTQTALNQIEAILNEAGCRKTDVVKTTILLTNMDDFPVVNKVYADFFEDHRPARATYSVVGLPKGAKIEIEAVALAP